MSLKLVGYVARTKGLNGDLLVNTMDIGDSIIKSGEKIFIGFSLNFAKEYICTNWKKDGNNYILHLKNINDIDTAATLKENGIYIESQEEEIIEEDDINIEIIDYEVINSEDKTLIGTVKEILIMPANDVLVVNTANGELPVPYIREFVKRISHKYKKVYIEVMDGLMDLIKK